MFYEAFTAERFFTEITIEAEARALLRRSRFQGTELQCPSCQAGVFYAIRTRPEVRTCRECHRQVRLRVGTLNSSSKCNYFSTSGTK